MARQVISHTHKKIKITTSRHEPFKGIVHHKMKILSLITPPHVVTHETFVHLQNTNEDVFDEIRALSDPPIDNNATAMIQVPETSKDISKTSVAQLMSAQRKQKQHVIQPLWRVPRRMCALSQTQSAFTCQHAKRRTNITRREELLNNLLFFYSLCTKYSHSFTKLKLSHWCGCFTDVYCSCVAFYRGELFDLITNILICVLKMNEELTGL